MICNHREASLNLRDGVSRDIRACVKASPTSSRFLRDCREVAVSVVDKMSGVRKQLRFVLPRVRIATS